MQFLLVSPVSVARTSALFVLELVFLQDSPNAGIVTSSQVTDADLNCSLQELELCSDLFEISSILISMFHQWWIFWASLYETASGNFSSPHGLECSPCFPCQSTLALECETSLQPSEVGYSLPVQGLAALAASEPMTAHYLCSEAACVAGNGEVSHGFFPTVFWWIAVLGMCQKCRDAFAESRIFW